MASVRSPVLDAECGSRSVSEPVFDPGVRFYSGVRFSIRGTVFKYGFCFLISGSVLIRALVFRPTRLGITMSVFNPECGVRCGSRLSIWGLVLNQFSIRGPVFDQRIGIRYLLECCKDLRNKFTPEVIFEMGTTSTPVKGLGNCRWH